MKERDLQNLNKMLHFCVNNIDCRKKMLNEYFGEQLKRNGCLACDNCCKNEKYKEEDVCKQAALVAGAVRDLCGGHNNCTLLHMVDVLKGSTNKKNLNHAHIKSSHYGKLSNWKKEDIQRLNQKLVADEYLKEVLVVSANQHYNMYLKVGPKIEGLFCEQLPKILLKFNNAQKTAKRKGESDGMINDETTPRKRIRKQ